MVSAKMLGYTTRSVLSNSKHGLLHTISPKKVPKIPKWETVAPPTPPPNTDLPQLLIRDAPQEAG